MKHIGWFTLAALCMLTVRGFDHRGSNSHNRNLIQMSQNKANGIHMENEVFDNSELKDITSLKEALNKSSNRVDQTPLK